MMGYTGEIRLFAGNFAPAGWALCNGQTLTIDDYVPLFDRIGTTYGGDGETSFTLPNLSGDVAIHNGNGFLLGKDGSAPFGMTQSTSLQYIIATAGFVEEYPLIGEVRTFAFGLTPNGWAQCAGQTLPIQQNTTLFMVLGYIYGGNPQHTFGVPNLQGTAATAPTVSAVNSSQAAGIGWLVMNMCISTSGIVPQRQ